MTTAGGAKATILIVEDDADIRNALAVVLTDAGYRVATAANGREGLERLREIGRPCLILLDLMMPIMNGSEFLARLRAAPADGKLPVIITSAWAEEAAKHRGATEAFVKKPIELDVLLATVERLCPARTDARDRIAQPEHGPQRDAEEAGSDSREREP